MKALSTTPTWVRGIPGAALVGRGEWGAETGSTLRRGRWEEHLWACEESQKGLAATSSEGPPGHQGVTPESSSGPSIRMGAPWGQDPSLPVSGSMARGSGSECGVGPSGATHPVHPAWAPTRASLVCSVLALRSDALLLCKDPARL